MSDSYKISPFFFDRWDFAAWIDVEIPFRLLLQVDVDSFVPAHNLNLSAFLASNAKNKALKKLKIKF